jgi:hypothetical protein
MGTMQLRKQLMNDKSKASSKHLAAKLGERELAGLTPGSKVCLGREMERAG